MSNTLTFILTYTQITCGTEGCGVTFALEDGFIAERRKDHKTWYCPNGHRRHYPALNETEKLREENGYLERRLACRDEDLRSERASHAHTKGRLTATKGVLTKTKKRIGNGVCPCCNRHFTNVERHMHTQHPDYQGATA